MYILACFVLICTFLYTILYQILQYHFCILLYTTKFLWLIKKRERSSPEWIMNHRLSNRSLYFNVVTVTWCRRCPKLDTIPNPACTASSPPSSVQQACDVQLHLSGRLRGWGDKVVGVARYSSSTHSAQITFAPPRWTSACSAVSSHS